MVMSKENKEIFFVEVREPSNVRKSILESLKDIVESLKKFERFKELREQKMSNVDKLRADLKEINKLVSGLKEILPETKIREMKLKPAVKQKVRQAKSKNFPKK